MFDRGNERMTPSSSPTFGVKDEADNDCEQPPDGGYGWVCVAACFIINMFTWGIMAVGRIQTPDPLRKSRPDYK